MDLTYKAITRQKALRYNIGQDYGEISVYAISKHCGTTVFSRVFFPDKILHSAIRFAASGLLPNHFFLKIVVKDSVYDSPN